MQKEMKSTQKQQAVKKGVALKKLGEKIYSGQEMAAMMLTLSISIMAMCIVKIW